MKRVIHLTIFLIFLAVCPGLKAAKYVVSGAGADVNGTYEDSGSQNNNHPFYLLNSNIGFALLYESGVWMIASIETWNEGEAVTVKTNYYYNYTDNPDKTPPSTGWIKGYGNFPMPIVHAEMDGISYGDHLFTESAENDGSIHNQITITCANTGGETFTGINGEDFAAAGKVVVSHLPVGLTARIIRKDDLSLLAVLTGNAASHNNANDVSNLTFSFQNAAFSGGNASVVTNAYRNDLKINFIQIYNVGPTGDFTTVADALAAAHTGDVLNLAAGIFTESGLTVGNLSNLSNYLSNVTIQGQGAQNTIVQGASSSASASGSVFLLDSYTTVTFKNLTIRNGNSDLGGGIYSAGNQLNLLNVDISGNIGGGIYAPNYNKVSLTNCTIHDNTGGSGLQLENGTATIVNSTIAYNTGNSGISCDGGVLNLTNCTVNYNQPAGMFINGSGTVSIVNSMLVGNNGADYKVINGVTLNDLGYNIVENQTSVNASGNWLFGNTSDILFNKAASGSSSTHWNRNNAVLANQSVYLDPQLFDNTTLNGTKTLAIGSTSFAVNAGTNTGAPTTDQRGMARNGTTDIGAYEYAGISVVTPTVVTTSISSMNYTSATMGGNVSANGGATVTESGVVYSLSGTPDISDTKVQMGSGNGTFSQSVSGLLYHTTYYVRAYAINSAGTGYGTSQTFTTTSINPVISNLNGEAGSFRSGYPPLTIDIGGDATVTDPYALGYNGGSLTVAIASASSSEMLSLQTSANVSLSNGMNAGSTVAVGGINIGTIVSGKNGQAGNSLVITFNANATDDLITTLLQNLTYSNNSLVSLGTRSISVTVQDASALSSNTAVVSISTYIVNQPPTLTMDASSVYPAFMKGGSAVNLFSGDGVGATASTVEAGQTFKGFTLTVTNVSDGSSEQLDLDDAYIPLTNGTQGTSSGNSLHYSVFVSGSTATLTFSGASLPAADLEALIDQLTYLDDNDNPTLGSRVITITSLTDSGGTTNGGHDTSTLSVSSVVTVSTYLPPTVTTTPVTTYGTHTATMGGNVTSDGGATITDRGLFYSTTDDTPTRDENNVFRYSTNRGGTGAFSFSVGQLWDGQTYYVRAYATNSQGISYGSTVTFKTTSLSLTISSKPDTVVAYGSPYFYAVGASTAGGESGTITVPTMPGWLSLTAGGQNHVNSYGNVPANIGCAAKDDAGNIYAYTSSGSSLYKIQQDGTTTLLGSGLGSVSSMEVADGYIYLSTSSGSNVNLTIRRIPLSDPTAAQETFATILHGVSAMTHRDGWIYATNYYSQKIYRISESTKEVQQYIDVSGSGSYPSGLTFDQDGNLFIVNQILNPAVSFISKYVGQTISSDFILLGTISPYIQQDATGNFYVLSTNYGLRKFNSDFSTYQEFRSVTYASSLLYTAYGTLVAACGTALNRIQTCANLTGTPSKSDLGKHTVLVRATNDTGYTEQSFTIEVIDKTKPVIAASSPANGATNVRLNASMSVTFDEEVSVGTSGTLTLQSGANTLKSFDLSNAVDKNALTLSADKKTLSFSLPTLLPSNALVAVAISDGFVKDMSGNAFAGTTIDSGTWSFLTMLAQNPLLSNLDGDSGSFKEGDSPLLLDNGANASVTDSNGSGFNGGNLTVAVTSASASENLAIKTSAVVTLSNGMNAGSTVSVGGTAVGTIATGKEGQGGHDLVVTLNASATAALISILIQDITYSNISEVALGYRSVLVTFQDAFVYTSAASTVTINTIVVNDPPILTITAAYPTFVEHGLPVNVYSGASASTVEEGQTFTGFSFMVTNLLDGASEQLVIDGSNIVLANGTKGTTSTNNLTYNVSVSYSGGKYIAAVTISNGSLSAANLQSILNNLSYNNSSASPSTNVNRLFWIQSLKDNGGTANGGNDTASLFIASSVSVVATSLPTVSTTAITAFNSTSATMGGNVTADGGATVTERGVVYSTSDTTPTIGEAGVAKDVNGSGTGTFSKSVTGLSSGTTYYVQAYATNAEGTNYGSLQSFTTMAAPTVSTTSVTTFNTSSATMGGNVTADGGATVTERGVVYSTSDNTPMIGETGVTKDANGSGTGTFSKSISGLSSGTTYYMQAYATSFAGTTYGSMQSFTTTAAPTVTTTAITTFNSTSATMGGNVTADGGATVTERGVVYSTSDTTPTIGETGVTQDVNGTTGTGTFSKSVAGLSNGTAYYVRSYAKNSVGTTYGSTQSLTTTALATVSTTSVTTFNSNSATMGGNVTSDGGATVTERGVVYSSSDNTPTIGETGVTQDMNGTTGTGTFNKSVTGLSSGTAYYVRAYATNSVGTIYGSMQSFTTTAAPTVTTTAITTYNGTSATMGGIVTADGGATVTERGVVYSTSDNTPTIGEAGVTQNVNGTIGSGTFSKSITGLSGGTTYYTKAYATNSEGTTYGNMQSFTTTGPPAVATTAITVYDANSATLGGNVNADGGTTVTERGVVYSTSDNTPTIGENGVTKDVNGTTGTGTFSKSITDLSGGTTYYVQAYAINSEGTTYGSMQSFTTLAAPTITTTAVTTFNSTSAMMGGNVTSDGGATVTQRGVVYSSYDNNPTMGRPGVLKDVSGTTGTGTFSKSISGLSNSTTYYVRAYVINSQGTVYGSVQSFTTTAPPTVATTNITTFNNTSATLGGNVTADGGATVTERGVVYSSGDNTPTIGEADVSKVANGTSGTGTFSKSVTGLTNGTTYYVRAYATNSEGTTYGNTQSFTTTAPPIVSTSTITTYNSTSATLEGNVTASGGAEVTERGFAYSLSDNTPTIGEAGVTKDVSGTSGMGIFTNSVTGLSTGATYYVRAYATNDIGTAYGNVQSFTAIGPPTVSTTDITAYNSTSATMGGNVNATGGATVTERGVVYSSSDNTPTIGEAGVTKDVNGTTGTGTFSKSITGLSSGTTYYVVAYATNSEGTAYGNVKSFATPLGKPSVTTTGSANISAVSADVSGDITAVGSGNATVRGVCYNATGAPTVSDPKSETSGNYGTGAFTSTLPGLLANTTYYARAYATNSGGTGYGDQVSFTTLAIPANPTSITATYTTLCNGASTQLTANGALGTVYWYTGGCGGTQVTTGNPVNVTPLASTTYYARNFNNGAYSAGCASIDIVVQPRPTVADLKASGTGIRWYLTPTGGTALAPSTQLINGQHYWASQTIEGLESVERLDVLVTMTNP